MRGMMRDKVCFDTHILIWGIKEECEKGDERQIPRAKMLIEQCKGKVDIIIPTPVLAEILSGTSDRTKQNAVSEFCYKRALVASFDVPAAKLYARHWPLVKQLRSEQIGREHMKFDLMIASIALAQKCQCIYSLDQQMQSIGESGLIEVRGLPDGSYQPELF